MGSRDATKLLVRQRARLTARNAGRPDRADVGFRAHGRGQAANCGEMLRERRRRAVDVLERVAVRPARTVTGENTDSSKFAWVTSGDPPSCILWNVISTVASTRPDAAPTAVPAGSESRRKDDQYHRLMARAVRAALALRPTLLIHAPMSRTARIPQV